MLLPAFGLPTRPTSAITLSSSRSVRASPGSPGVDSRGAVGGRLESHVALAAPAAGGHHHPLAGVRKVLQHVPMLGVDDDGAGRDVDHQVVGRAAVALGAAAGLAVLGLPLAAVGQGGQAIDALSGQQHDAAAVAAVAAVRPAAGNVFLPAETDAAVAPLARLHANFDFVNERDVSSSVS